MNRPTPAALGYAIPGAVIAVGILVPLGRLDNLLAGAIQAAFGVDVGLVLTGTIVALVYAYLVRFLAVALQTVEAGLARVTPSMEDAARSLGAGPLATLARVHAPLLASSLAEQGRSVHSRYGLLPDQPAAPAQRRQITSRAASERTAIEATKTVMEISAAMSLR